ncbi:MAG TPA: sigma-70 family RNA polymerase sigma factor [Ktedonobacteraceae bacterium]|jgi:RNA polymerase primary sigma factor
MTTAVEWEISLRERIAYVELLGELNLSSQETGDLGQALAQLIGRNNEQLAAVSLLSRNYPACLAVYLVCKGISGYDGGDYWTAVGEETGLTSSKAHQEMGRAFEQFLHDHGLPLFGNLRGLRYVTPILLHGGIPDTSLGDYFTYFLLRMQTHSVASRTEARDMISEWLHKYAAVPVDKSVPRFLEYGGSFALDFVTRCLELSEYYENYRHLPAPEAIGLPPRVLSAYKTWHDEQDRSTTRRQPRLRLQRPVLVLDPWGDGPVIELPAQFLSSDLPVESGRWLIESREPGAGQYHEAVAFTPAWSEAGWETGSYQYALPRPANYSITLEISDGKETRPLRSWYFYCASSEQRPSLLAFDGESGEFLAARDTLPARLLWLLIPRGQQLHIPGGVKRAEVAQFVGSWAPFRAEAWDPGAAPSITLNGQEFAVEPDMARFQPSLQGQEVAGIEPQAGQPRLFAERLPDLLIPLPPQRDPAIEAQRWRLTICALQAGTRRQFLSASLAGLHYCVGKAGVPQLQLALSEQIELAGIRPGMFEIALRGPLGRDMTFLVALVPGLHVRLRAQDRVRVPVQGKVPDLVFTLSTDVESQLECALPGVQIQSAGARVFRVLVPGDCSRVDLRLIIAQEEAGCSPIPLTLLLPVLTWALLEGRQVAMRDNDWQTAAISRPQAWLEQADTPRLLVSLASGTRRWAPDQAALTVAYSQRAVPHQLSARGRNRTWLAFNLKEAEDSVRSGRDGSIRFELELPSLSGRKQPLLLPVLFLEQTPGLTSLQLVGELSGTCWHLTLTWQEQVMFNNRHLLLWPLWRPWEQALDLPLADGAQSSYAWSVPRASLTPGRYRAELILIDPWSGALPARPFVRTATSVDLVLGTARERIAYLREVAQDPPGLLEQLLASESEPHRRRRALELWPVMAPGFVSQVLVALLTIQGEAADVGGSFTTLGQLLLREPLELLAAISRLSLTLSEQARRPFEELLWRIAPECESLLRQIYQDATLDLEDLQALFPACHLSGIAVEALVPLRDAGILVRDCPAHEQAEPWEITDFPHWVLGDNQLDSVRLYINELRQYPLLSAEQEQRLAAKITAGREAEQELQQLVGAETLHVLRTGLLESRVRAGLQARQRLAQANLRLVVSIAKRSIGRGMDFLDVIQNGNLGLLRAIDKFDGKRGYRFSTYATWWIRQSIARKLVEDASLIRLPSYLAEERLHLQKTMQRLRLLLDREPTASELNAQLPYTPEKVKLLLTLSQAPVSLDQMLGEENDTTLGDILAQEASDPEELVVAASLHDQIQLALSLLSRRERVVLELRFGLLDNDGKTLEEIGRTMQVTRERVRQIEERALEKLRRPGLQRFLRDYAAVSSLAEEPVSIASTNDLPPSLCSEKKA